MFKDKIDASQWVSDLAEQEFGQYVYGSNYCGDNSFLCTLRALYCNKLTEEENINLVYSGERNAGDDVIRVSNVVSTRIGDAIYSSNRISIQSIIFTGNTEEALKAIREAARDRSDGKFVEVEKVNILFKKSFPIVCFVNPEIRSTVIFVIGLNLQKWHYMQCAIPGFLPWFSDIELSEKDIELLYSIREKTSQKYISVLNELWDSLNIKEEFIRRKLEGFEHLFEREQITHINSQIESYYLDIEDLRRSIAAKMSEIREMNIRAIGLQMASEKNNESELMRYFLANKKLSLIAVNGSNITFTVKDFFVNFDEVAAKKYIDNKSSYFYRYCRGEQEKNDFEMLLNAIFIDQELKIRVCGKYTVESGRSRVDALSCATYDHEHSGYMPNPHLDNYSCLGNYINELTRAIQEFDYVTVVETCISSCKSLNLHDLPVMERFVDKLYGKDDNTYCKDYYKCIQLPNGINVGIDDAIQWLKENGGNSNE